MSDDAKLGSSWGDLVDGWGGGRRLVQILFERVSPALKVFYWAPLGLLIYTLVVGIGYGLKAQWVDDWFRMLKPVADVATAVIPYELWESWFRPSAPLAGHFVLVGAAVASVLFVGGVVAILTRNADDWRRLSDAIPLGRRMTMFAITFGWTGAITALAAIAVQFGELTFLPFLPYFLAYLGLMVVILVAWMRQSHGA